MTIIVMESVIPVGSWNVRNVHMEGMLNMDEILSFHII